ncbi:MAG: enoyl-CoA hydratase/isomerase family protein [Deltaproteobacteria bacterium]|nr:MAG: enoyl-CoA hydratase/isomerase family protein [Deltaproteobacteria bacterium]
MDRHIEVTIDGAVAELVLARPDARNAMTEAMGREIRDAVAAVNADGGVRALVVRGEGSAFSAGGDFDMLAERQADSFDSNRAAMLAFYRLYLAIRTLRVPSIAAVHGPAVGAGACFAIACDLRFAGPRAKFGFTFVRLGLHPGMGATYLLPRLVGPAAAAELLLSGRVIEADRAARLGLVNAVVDDPVAAARAQAAAIAECAPIAVAQTVATLRGALDRSLDDALELEARAQAMDYATEDLAEGIAAARARRRPVFSGR